MGILTEFGSWRVVELSARLNAQTPCYPTDPPFNKSWHVWFGEQAFCVSKLDMGAHSGTHVDAPLHFLGRDFPGVADLPLQKFMGEAVALERQKQPGENLAFADIAGITIRSGDIVLFRTGWDQRTGSPRFFQDEWPGVESSLVEELVGREVKAVGGDFPSVDSPAALEAGAPAHKLAGRAGMPIFEGLVNLDQVAGQRFFFMGLPLRVEGGEASPIRAVALVPPALPGPKGKWQTP